MAVLNHYNGGLIMAIGKRIKFFRNRKGMTQKQLSKITKEDTHLAVSAPIIPTVNLRRPIAKKLLSLEETSVILVL